MHSWLPTTSLQLPVSEQQIHLVPRNALTGLPHLKIAETFPGSSAGKESTCNAGDPLAIPGSEVPLEKGQAAHSSIPGLPW